MLCGLFHVSEPIRFESLEEFAKYIEQLERQRAEEYRKKVEEAWKLLEKVKRKKPRKKVIPREAPVLPPQAYLYWREQYERLIEEEKYPEWILEELKKETQLKFRTKKLVVETPSVVVEELERGLFPYVRKLELRGVSQEWHKLYIAPFTRNLLERLRATKEKWREAEYVELPQTIEAGGSKITIETGYYVAPRREEMQRRFIGHLFVSTKPFLYCILPISHPRWEKATIKAVIIFNPLDEPIKVKILHLLHGTEDEFELPPKHIAIFVHEFKYSLESLEGIKFLEETKRKLREAGVSEELIKKIEKAYREIAGVTGWGTWEKMFAELQRIIRERLEREKRREIMEKLREFRKKYGHILEEVKREWIII